MSFKNPELNASAVSLCSSVAQSDDWDRSLDVGSEPSSSTQQGIATVAATPRSSIIFPTDPDVDATPKRSKGTNLSSQRGAEAETGHTHTKGKRSLSELMQLHAERGTEPRLIVEEASRVAEVLGQWINAGSSPYEGEDDFFARSQDDLNMSSRVSSSTSGAARPRGQSESVTVSGRQSS